MKRSVPIHTSLVVHSDKRWMRFRIKIFFQEATIVNLVRAKTHPANSTICLTRQCLLTRKDDFAEWQLLESK
jgi:hypothetical protein